MTARTYPYTGGDGGSHHFDAVPSWLNDLLLEQTPGREMRNFRLAVRVAWVMDLEYGKGGKVAALKDVRRKVLETSGVCMAVVDVCLARFGNPAWPHTSAEEVGNG